jgi:hypothetical protein
MKKNMPKFGKWSGFSTGLKFLSLSIKCPFDKLLRNSEHFNFNIWESFHENVPIYTIIK